jgi:hypothetical protein
MLRIATAFARAFYHNKIIRLDLNKKTQFEDSPQVKTRKMKLSEHVRQKERVEEEEVSLRMLKRSLEQQ